MKPKRHVWYTVSSSPTLWYQHKQWMTLNALNPKKEYGNYAYTTTFKKAIHIALKCNNEMHIEKWFVKHGKRHVRDYVITADPSRPKEDRI
jgi:hypothetical protein